MCTCGIIYLSIRNINKHFWRRCRDRNLVVTLRNVNNPYYSHHPRVAKPTYLVYLATFLDMPNRLPLGKYKFDTWFPPSEVLHDSSMCLRNPLSYIHTYEPLSNRHF
jgi:hypothetical protein